MEKRIWLRKLIYLIVIIGITIIAFFFFKNSKESDESETIEEPIIENNIKKNIEVIEFGNWQPSNKRKVLGTVKSSSDISIYSNLSGDIAKVFVDIGDNVYKGEILAKFSRENDVSQISYENAVRAMENTRSTTENSIQSAEIALENAKNDLEQTISSTKQTHSQSFTLLFSQAKNAETTITNSLNWADKLLGASQKFRYELDPNSSKVGRNNSILKNDTKNLLETVLREVGNSRDLADYEKNDESKILSFANGKNKTLKSTQNIIRNINELIRGTTSSRDFSAATKSQLQQEVEGIAAKIDANIVSLESQIEAAKSGNIQIDSTILAAENRVRNAEASLSIAISSAENQISNSQSQRNLAAKSLNDLEVRAPFDGVISAKFANDFDRATPGQKLFSIVSADSVPEIIAYLTAEESHLLSDIDRLKIELNDGEIIDVESVSVSGKINEASQKMEVKFRGNSDALLIGSIANVLLPVSSDSSNLIPISAISFEPDGAEVFVVNSQNIVERKKVQTGKMVSSAVEILSGIDGENIIRYRNRVNAGDEVEIKATE